MGTSAGGISSTPYVAIPSGIVVLQNFHRPQRCYQWFLLWRASLISAAALIIFLFFAYIFFPSDPIVQISRLNLNMIKVNTSPAVTVDLSFSLMMKVRNPDFFSADYDLLQVSVGYRGRELGSVKSAGGVVKARGSSYLDAQLDLDGVQVAKDSIFLIRDLARGVIAFDTVTLVRGHLGLMFLRIPLKAKVACEVYVNVKDQTVEHQDCTPE